MLVKKSIIEAARDKAATQRADYSIKALPITGTFAVKNLVTGARYVIDMDLKFCSCPACKRDNYCKHIAMLQADRRGEREYAAIAQGMEQTASAWETQNLH